jgi:type I restriction enzyme S subunit
MTQLDVGWRQLKISNLIEKKSLEIGDGYRARNIEMDSTGLPFARAGNINNGFNFEGSDLLSEKSVALAKNKISQTDDSVITTKGTFGRVAYVRSDTPKFVYSPQLCYWRVKDLSVIHPRFIYYWLQGPDFIAQAFKVKSSTDMADYASLTDQRRMSISAPDIDTQKKIAAILSAYDELIENNKRRIALLEKMAEEIYREWFVRFRFPGHDKVKFKKGLPEGWRSAELKELAAVNPSSISRQDKPETILYVDISSVSTNQIEEVTNYPYSEAPGRARRRVKHGDVIWSSVRPANRAYCLIYEPPENLIVSTGFAVIRPNTATPFSFLFFAVTSNPFVDQMTMVAKGAAYPATSFDDFENAKLLVPPDELLKSFHEKAETLFRQKHFLQQQCERLKPARNLLLPRLISGKLSVENLDIQFPPSMEKAVHEA